MSSSSRRFTLRQHQFALLIVRNPFVESKHYNKWLAVKETGDKGWWIPGGAVAEGETFTKAAHRSCLEEAGINVTLLGILRVDHWFEKDEGRMRVIYYAEAKSLHGANNLKSVANDKSEEARWVSMPEFQGLGRKKPGLRGEELLEWVTYLENGGHVYPLEMFGDEGKVQPPGKSSSSFGLNYIMRENARWSAVRQNMTDN